MFGRWKHPKEDESAEIVRIPVLCKFWEEDSVWNGAAEHLAVAAFGDTFEEARNNLASAIIGHIQSVAEAGQLNQIVMLLKKRAEDHMLVEEIVADSVISKMLVPVDREMVCA